MKKDNRDTICDGLKNFLMSLHGEKIDMEYASYIIAGYCIGFLNEKLSQHHMEKILDEYKKFMLLARDARKINEK